MGISPEDYMLPAEREIRMLSPEGTLLPAEQQGTGPGHEYPIPSDEVLLEAYERLMVGRRVNDQNTALVRQGRLAVYPSSHGQEACQVAAAMCLEDNDWLFPTYRDTVAVISKGVDPLDVMVSFRGDWHCGYDPKEHKTAAQATPLTTQLLHAVGAAHAAVLRGEDTVVLAMCGDGATSEGDFHEALNFAAVFRLPVVFFVQNNGYAISVPLARQSAAPTLAHKAVGYGMAGERVDGNDLVALMAALRRAVDLARTERIPLLVEAHTYRMQAHTNADDDTRYREREEVKEWAAKDPVLRMETYLRDKGVLDEAAAARVSEHCETVAASLRDAMNADVNPDPLEMFDHVFSEPTQQLREQRDWLAEELAAEAAEGRADQAAKEGAR
ncbi:pyruvate dehydrogenase (acetyl-transferring) E1 component subunit alpha [Kocuria sp. JC486]|uniref:Pyruvate dehydrogenase (Acetyl-transferring) E1 component subunit alpha n=2 Tax=Kocuria soli TaxID=2485125 RepID=A0A3N4A8E8_9MICC|nr:MULTISPECIES: pyruvate dehydrogenase (acetyl-transferring) E1 component subunit alpha [Kocuria]NHU86024.1 pyruvate dehydrogenase (acetyl-transferring) E1 component subunit alpha [Kocuria sp. JC486]ROZ65825.1 pyruvate dehydrogenase (acetyl-transferring) E1 component subunit alpha [Kocuria soli]